METRLKRFLSLALAILMVFSMMPQITLGASAATPDKLYLKPNSNWTEANARFAAYFFGNGDKWVSMTDSNGDGTYEVEVPSGYPSVIFCRMNPSASANNWNNKWNQTGDLTVPTDGKNLFTVPSGSWDGATTGWSTYTYVEPVYYVAGTNNNWTANGTKMTRNSDGSYSVTVSNVTGELKFKVTDGTWSNCWGNGDDSDGNTVVNVATTSNVTIKFVPSSKSITTSVTCVHASADCTTEEKAIEGCTGDGYKKVTCACGEVVENTTLTAPGHDFGENEQYCKNNCGTENENYKPACEHPEDKLTTEEQAATCTVDGYKKVTCACGEVIENTTLTAPGHDFGENEQYCKNNCGTENEDYVAPKEIGGQLGKGYVSLDPATEGRYRVYAEVLNIYATESISFKLYSGETLIGSTALNSEKYTFPYENTELGMNMVISGKASSSWLTVWEDGMPRADLVPDKLELYIDGKKFGENVVVVGNIDNLGTPLVWEAIPGVNPAPVNYAACIDADNDGEVDEGEGYETLEVAFAAATEGDTITLLAPATPTLTSQRAITKASVINLNGKTLTLTEDDLYFGTTTFENGTIVVDPSVVSSTAVFWMFEGQTLTIRNTKIVATGVTGTYLIGTNGGTGANIVLDGATIEINNEAKTALTAVIAGNSANDVVTISDTTINVSNIDGRVALGGNYTVKQNSTINANGVKEGFYIRANQTLSIEDTSTVTVVLNDTNGRYGINLSDATAVYSVADTATVNATVYQPAPAATVYEVSTKAELKDAVAAAQDGDTIKLLADIDYGTDHLTIERAITLDLGSKTLTTRARNYGLALKNDGITVTNGKLNHAGTVAAIKVWNAAEISNLEIDVTGTSSSSSPIGGIVIQKDSAGVDTIKNVNIYSTAGQGIANGIETYNCGNATEPVIGSMENVTINAVGTAMNISAPCGTATNCSFNGGVNGIELALKGTYSATLNLVGCTVNGGVFAHDEFTSNAGAVNNGTLSLTVDEKTTGASAEDITLTIARAENVEGILADVMTSAEAKVGDTYYTSLVAAVKAAQSGDVVTMLQDVTITATESNGYGKTGINLVPGVTLDGNNKKLTVNGANSTWDSVIGMTGGEVKNLTISGAMRGVFMGGASGDVVIDNCVFEDVIYTFNSDAGSKDYTVTIKNSAINGWTSFSDVHKSVTFENCSFGEGSGYAFLRPYQATTFNNCEFEEGYGVDTSKTADNALAFNGCNYAGAALSQENGAMFSSGKVMIDGKSVSFNPPIGTITYGYTSQTAIWGEASNANAEESYVVELYFGDVKIATSTLAEKYLTGEQKLITWSIPYAGQNNADWVTVWEEGYPNKDSQPTAVKLVIDGDTVSENVVKMSGPDDLNKVVWTELEIFKPDVAQVGDKTYKSVLDAINAAVESGASEVKVLASVRELMPTDVEIIVNADLTITADEAVTVEFYNEGTNYDFIFNSNNNNTITIAENVTFELADRTIWLGYYGNNVTVVVDGTLIGGYQMWVGAETKVSATGKLVSGGEAMVIRRGATIDVNGGKIEANYFSILSGNIKAKDATIVSGPIWVSNTGGYTNESGVKLELDNTTWTSTGNIKLVSDKTAELTLTNGSVLSVTGTEYGASQMDANSTININGSTLTVKSLTNNGTINVNAGESTLNIPTLTGSSIDLNEGAIVKDTTVGGAAYVAGNVTFRGDNTFTMITDYGDYYSSTTPSKWTVEKGASLILTSFDRYGLGYGDVVTIIGEIENALTARENLTDADADVNMYGGLVGMTNSAAPDAQNKLTIEDAYVIFGVEGDKSFGNKAGSYYGNYEIVIDNSVITANAFKFYEDKGSSVVTVTGTDLLANGIFMTNDTSSKFIFTDSVIVSNAKSNGSDDKNQNAGELILNNTSLTYNAPFTNVGTLTLGAGSSLTAPSISGTGKIIIDATGMTAGEVATISGDASGFTGTIEVINNDNLTAKVVDGNIVLVGYAAKIGTKGYETLTAAVAAVKDGETITILAGELSEGTIKLPATLKNVTIKGEEGAILKDMTIIAADGNSISYDGLTFDGITFENSRISITGWRNNGATVKDLTVTNCVFKNLNDTTNSAPVHINMDATEAVENFTFTNNVIDGATGGSKSGVYAQVTGKTTFTGNVINNVSFRPYVIQVTTDDGIADEFIVTGNTFSGSAAGRAQGLGNNAEGTDTVKLVVSENIFKGITNSQQICYWNFNPETTTADLSKNYYDIDIQANPNRIYFNSAAANVGDLIEMGIFPYYADEAKTQLVEAPVAMIGDVAYTDLHEALTAAKKGETVLLLADVDLEGKEWTPVGTSSAPFQATFDGQGHTISNLVITGGSKSNQGLFGYTTNGEIKNLTINNAKVSGYLNIGVVAGTPYTSKYTNIKVTGHVEVEGYAYVGGVGGKNAYANWTDITVDVDSTSYVKANSEGYRTYVGGVVGFNGEGGHTFKNISSNINVIGSTCDIGGIFGIAHYGNKFENITCSGNVTSTGEAEEIGGIAGVWHNQAGQTVTFTNVSFTGTVSDVNGTVEGVDIVGGAYNANNETAANSGSLIIDGKEVWLCAAKIGETKYQTVDEAFAAAKDGDEVKILVAGSYAPAFSGKDITVTGAVDGVEFTNIGAYGMNGANVTFNNVTFTYATNSTYKGLQHAGNLVYNNCTINGQVFLYGASETFVGCTFNTTDADNYNVWTYGAKVVAFNDCTFNCAGKSVLVYNEGKDHSTALTVTGCEFIASAPVEGKAAIEIDTSLNTNGSSTVVIDGETTATGFGTGSVSGNSLWNDKKNKTNISVTVDGVEVWPNWVAQVGEKKFESLQAAIDAAVDGDVITLLTECDEDVTVVQAPDVKITIDGNGNTMSGTITVNGKSAAYATAGLTIKNVKFDATNISKDASINLGGDNSIRYTSNVTVENCSFTGTGNVKVGIKNYTGGCKNLTVTNCTATGVHSLIQVKGVAGITVKDVTVDGKNGISVGTSTNVVIENADITATGYGVRADGSGAYDLTVKDSTISAQQPIVVRKNTADGYQLTLEDNTLTASNENGYEVTFTAGDDGTYETPAVSVVLSGVENVDVFPVYQAKIGTIYYATVAEAIAAAEKGSTITMIADSTESMIILKNNLTLDLNGNTLAADYFVTLNGTQVLNSKTSGYLKVAKTGISLQATNNYVPVWNGVDGYYLVDFAYGTKLENVEGGVKYYFIAKPRNGGGTNYNYDVVELLKNGALDNDLEFCVDLAWGDEQGIMEQTFTYKDSMVAQVYTENSVLDNSGIVFTITVSGMDSFDSVTMNAVVKSMLGQEDAASVKTIK